MKGQRVTHAMKEDLMGYDLYMANTDGDEGYFRANIWSMQIIRRVLEGLDLLTDEEPPKGAVDEAMTDFESAGRGIPLCKMSSNDGWFVTPAECAAVATGIAAKKDRVEPLVAAALVDYAEYEAKFNKTEPKPVTNTMAREWSERIFDFATYCELAAKKGGFRVF
jgi:hypothetical protein